MDITIIFIIVGVGFIITAHKINSVDRRLRALEEDSRYRKTRQKFNEALNQHQSSFQLKQD